jgi:transposase
MRERSARRSPDAEPQEAVYPAEFRSEAVRLARSPGHTIDGVAHDLGIAKKSLRRWIQAGRDRRRRAEALTTEEREELRTLRRRVRVLEEERTILVKAAAFFAKENDRTR